MNYKQHYTCCILTVIIASIIGFKRGIFNLKQIEYFLIPVIPYSFVITSDLDSATSIPTKILNKYHINIFKSFPEWGHRHSLHNWLWGPINLIGWWLIPALWLKIDVPIEVIEGATICIWCHIVCDWIYSDTKEMLKYI